MTKSTGVVRKMDPLGRIVFPIELRRNFELEEGTPIEIFTEGKNIILRKYEPGCFKCGMLSNLTRVEFLEKDVCPNCLKELKKAISLKIDIKEWK